MNSALASRRGLLSTIARGLAYGACGTAAMTGWQNVSAKLLGGEGEGGGEDGGSQGHGGGQGSAGDPWEGASAPAKVGRLILRSVAGRDVPPERIGLLTNVMHWGYGLSWGVAYALLTPRHPGG